MIIDSACECVEFSIECLVQLASRLEGAIVYPHVRPSPFSVFSVGAGFVETSEGVRFGLCGTCAEREGLKHPLDTLPFFQRAELRYVEGRRPQ